MTITPSPSTPHPTTPLQHTLAAQLSRLDADPDDVDAWRIAARTLAEMGQGDDAVVAQRRALALAPRRADLWVELGAMLVTQGVREEPEACFQRALALEPFHHDARVRLGFLRLGRGDIDGAGEAFTQVLRAHPNHSGAVAGAAQVLDRRGHVREAWTLLQRTTCPPTSALAMAHATVARHAGVPAKALPIVRRQRRFANAADRVVLLHAEGDLHDALGDTERAWRSWSLANRERRLVFDPVAHGRSIQALIARTARLPAPTGPADDRPVFVLGMPRSGTTLVESILAAHPGIHGAGELEAIRDLAVALPRQIGHGATYLDHIDVLGDWGDALGRAYLEPLDALAPGAHRVVDKMPNNALHLALVAVALPGARIVWCERDADDVALSCFQQALSGGLPWATSLDGIRAWQDGLAALKAHWSDTLAQPIHTVRYEDLVADPEGESRKLSAFVGMPYDPAMLAFHTQRRAVATASWRQVQEPIHGRRVGRARAYAAYLGS